MAWTAREVLVLAVRWCGPLEPSEAVDRVALFLKVERAAVWWALTDVLDSGDLSVTSDGFLVLPIPHNPTGTNV